MREARHLTCDGCPARDPYGAERPVLPQLIRFLGWAALSLAAYVVLLLVVNYL